MMPPLDNESDDSDVDTSMNNMSIPDSMLSSDEKSHFEGFA